MPSSSASGLAISIHALRKSYGAVAALDGIDLDIRSGEFVTLLGPSGSGKTTLLMALAGFIMPTAGSIKFAGAEVVQLPPHKRNVGMVFQNYALFPHMTVEGNVGYPLRIRRIAKDDVRRRVCESLDLVRMSDLAKRKVDQLSGGQRQRVALARAIIFHPQILLMDEPLSALDKNLREQMQIEIKQLQRKLGITTVSVTHDQREAMTMADRIAVMNNGRLSQVDVPEQLYGSPATSFVAGFIGESTLIEVEVIDGTPFFMGKKIYTRHLLTRYSAKHHLVLRTDRLSILNNLDQTSQANFNSFTGTITELMFQGETVLAHLSIAPDKTIAFRFPTPRLSHVSSLKVGSTITVGLHVEDTVVTPDI